MAKVRKECLYVAFIYIEKAYDRVNRFQRQQPTSGGIVRSSDLQIVVNTSLQTVSLTVFRTRVSLHF